MKRTFANLGTEASIKNTLPSVNGDNENKQAIVPYKSRSGSIEILPQEEYPFEVGSSGEAIYYMKQERENLKTVGLYEDQGSPVEKQYIYEKGEDSDVEFTLYSHSGSVEEGTNLTVGDEYNIDPAEHNQYDFYINGNFIGTDETVYFILEEGMSVDGKIVITVKRQGGQNPKLMVKNSNAPGTGISTYTDDYQFVETIASFYQGQSGEVEIPLNTIIGISGMNFQATFSGTYGGVEYNDQQLMVEGNSFVYSPEGYKFWTNFQEGDEGILTT